MRTSLTCLVLFCLIFHAAASLAAPENIQLIEEEQKQAANKKDETIARLREELKKNEEQTLDFIFPSLELEKENLNTEEFFSKTEKEQLLELWRATLARNRTIQFVIKSLATNPNDIEQNNAVMQVLSRALFVPFYAMSAVANNAIVSGGSAVGARVIGDVIDSHNDKRDKSAQVTRTDLIVLFMLVDEVAQRLRQAYFSYKEAKVEQSLIGFELEPARIDAAEALQKDDGNSIYFTRLVLRDLERRERKTKLAYRTHRRHLVELAGQDAVKSVDLLLDLEIEEVMGDVLKV